MLKRFREKYAQMSANVRSGLWYTICSFVQKGISFITVPIFTRLLTTEQYGVVSIYYSWQSVLVVFCTLNLFSGVFNNGMIKYEEDRSTFLSSMQGLVTTITAGFFVIYLIFHEWLNSIFELDTPLMIFMFFEIVVSAAFSFWTARERFEVRYKKMVAITLIASSVAPLCSILAILIFPDQYGAFSRIIASAVVSIIIYGIIYCNNFIKGKKFFQKKYWDYGLRFNLPLLPHYLSTLILNQSDRLMISKMVSIEKAGIYSLSHNLAMVLNILTTSVNNAFAPWLYEKLKKKDYKGVAQIGNALFSLVAIALLLLMAFAPEVILIMGGEEYREAIYVIPPLTASLYFMFMYQIFANVEFYFEENKFITYASVCGSILNIILNYIFIQIFGYIAAGYTTLFCYIIFGIAHYLFMKKTVDKNISDKINLFDIRFISVIAVALLLISAYFIFTYEYAILRYFSIALVLLLVFLRRKSLIEMVKKIKDKEI